MTGGVLLWCSCSFMMGKSSPFLFLCIVFFYGWSSFAQQNHTPYTWRVSATVGPYLPSKYPGVTEIMQTIAGRASLFNEQDLGIELWGMHSSEDGASVNFGGLSVIKELKLDDVKELSVLIIGGLDSAYNKRAPGLSGIERPYRFYNGIHLGAALIVPLSGQWSVRGGGMVLNTPGMGAWIEMGVQYHFSGGGGEKAQ